MTSHIEVVRFFYSRLKCPLAWRGQFTHGDYGVPTMVLEAVASQDLHIWHAFLGIAGSNNDLNVLNNSPLFFDALKGEAPQVQFQSMEMNIVQVTTLLMAYTQSGQPS